MLVADMNQKIILGDQLQILWKIYSLVSGSMIKEVFNGILKKECLMNDTVFINKIFTMEKRVTSIFGILQFETS